MAHVGSIFCPSLSFEAEITKLVMFRGDSHLGANCQCETRAMVVLQMVATAFASPVDKEEAHHRPSRLFSFCRILQ